MICMKKNLVFAAALTAILATPGVFATNGYFSHGYSIKEKGLAGSGAALPQDAMAAANNPAGMVFVGNRWDLGASLFSPSPRSYNATTPAGFPFFGANGNGSDVESDNDFFLIPHFGRNWMLDANSSIGVSVYGNGGMNTEYPASKTPGGLGTFGAPGAPAGTAGVDLSQLFVTTTYAKKFSPTASWGVSGIVAYQRFEAKGLVNFGGISNDPGNLTDNGHDTSFGWGAKVGVQGEVAPGVTGGASYQTEIKMDEFDDYAGLFAEKGDFDIPSTWTVGLAWEIKPKSHLTLDIQKINYGDIKAIANPFSRLTGCLGGDASQCLGGSNGIGFGWEDMTIVKVGYQWETSPIWTWRVGYSKGDQPIPDTETLFNILAPGVIEEHFTFGFTKEMGKGNEFNFAAMYAPNNSVTGTPSSTTPSGDPQSVKIEMQQYEVAASWAWKF